MKRFAASIEIDAPPETVWRVLADIGGWPGWDPNTDRAKGVAETDQEVAFDFTYTPGRTVTSKVTAIDEPFLLEWTGGDEQLIGRAGCLQRLGNCPQFSIGAGSSLKARNVLEQ